MSSQTRAVIYYMLTFSSIILTLCAATKPSRPHIIFILADDLGWNDVGFHGSSQIPTPNIDALAYSGVILNRYYVSAICTPSRSALMTGKHPIHTGMQHTVLYGAEPRGLPLTEQILPQYLQKLGYRNHIVGKWHLGHYKREYTPLYRGFESHLGFWTGHQDYFDHTAMEQNKWGTDMRRGMNLAWDLHGQYSTDVFAKESVRVIERHNASQPLFLYVAHAAVHSGNPYNPIPAPDDAVAKFGNIENYKRQRFAGVLSRLDDSVGVLVSALQKAGMLEHSIIIFSSDNGGPAEGFNINAASNWPLRGVKNTLWEGGVRGAGLLWSPLIKKKQRVSSEMMHISDWLPTLFNAAGGDINSLPKNLYGVNQWQVLSEETPTTRTEILHNIDDIYGNSALTINQWKIVKGTTYSGQWDGWYGPSGRGGTYDIGRVLGSPTGKALKALKMAPTAEIIMSLRNESSEKCQPPSRADKYLVKCEPLKAPCLFDVLKDPCEKVNLADSFPALLTHLENELAKINETAKPPANLPSDPRADPRFWDHTWSNFGDYSLMGNAVNG